MTEDAQGRGRSRRKTWLALSALMVILALLIVPPYISVSRYKNRITHAISASIGRPVRLSSIELRLLPRPSFVLSDLVVEEDPVYGAEPVLHANSVTAAMRIVPLWRGRLEISRISVDEASLNVVRSGSGRWNLDPFFRSAARPGDEGARKVPFPYLEATNSRVNVKNGVEKLPFSLVNADLSVWQESPGEWRVRLRGQPARTDVSLDQADTGVVRMEASLRRTAELSQMPVHLDLDWKEAQLGQLSRLMLGSDEGWRGDLTGEVHVDGTAEAAQVKTRLRASGVHRAEFTPASPIDFDATCGFTYHYSEHAMQNLLCDSPVGDGRARLAGDVPGNGGVPRLSLELDRVPAQVALDALRTVRRGLDPSLEAGGAMSGRINYAPVIGSNGSAGPAPVVRAGSRRRSGKAKGNANPPGPLSGVITVSNLRLTGDKLVRPIQVVKVTIEPAPGQTAVLAATASVPSGGAQPLNISARLATDDYQVSARGSVGLPLLREMAGLAGVRDTALFDNLNGPPALVDVNASGPWLGTPASVQEITTADLSTPSPPASGTGTRGTAVPGSAAGTVTSSDRVSGTVVLRGSTWKADFLANPVEIAAATLNIDGAGARWDPVHFKYGSVQGTAMLRMPVSCEPDNPCRPQFAVKFDSLDGAALQAAILGARQPGTLFADLLARLRTGARADWPDLEGTVGADEFTLGPVTLLDVSANLHIEAKGTEITTLDAGLLGGQMHASGSVTLGDKPEYKLEGSFSQLNPTGTGNLLGMNWSGNGLDGNGQVEAAGFTPPELAATAKGTLHFDWRHGAIAESLDVEVPAVLSRFERWTADAEIAEGGITLQQNQVQHGVHRQAVTGSVSFGDPPKVTLGAAPEIRAARR